ncbi:sigma factor-like helix-turn-helix DNA-binding protein [Rummeliibacillus sp. NPDC094406]|uniref:sigma factor-like helix-turn-helix DNA-binding protein n=1 Tax=Rummeliibacillus sp. NPDC094406 TaxID=3364511 RepID=UPI003808057C
MKELINEYIATRKHTKKMYKALLELKDEMIDEEEIAKVNEDLATIRKMISSLSYSIEVMASGRFRGRSINRRAAYERDIPVSNEVLTMNSDKLQQMPYEHEVNEDEEEVKELLAKEISKVLDAKEREVFNLAANEFSHRQIAEIMSIPKSTVQSILKRCKSKIIAEGWVIV